MSDSYYSSDTSDSDEESRIKKENLILKEKIKKQKAELRGKIETARKKAYLKENPEEVERSEKMIIDVLEKHHLTEEMIQKTDSDSK